jgi:hypothetical protein
VILIVALRDEVVLLFSVTLTLSVLLCLERVIHEASVVASQFDASVVTVTVCPSVSPDLYESDSGSMERLFLAFCVIKISAGSASPASMIIVAVRGFCVSVYFSTETKRVFSEFEALSQLFDVRKDQLDALVVIVAVCSPASSVSNVN